VRPHDRQPLGVARSPESVARRFVCALVVVFMVVVTLLAKPLFGGHSRGDWREVFDGYGVGFSTFDTAAGQMHELVPRVANSGDRTHSALAIDLHPSADFDLRVEMRTLEQLRVGTEPNPWEVAWLVWRFDDSEHFYYLALKPNGWELGKRDPGYPGGQRFLATANSPSFRVGESWNDVRVHAVGSRFTVWVDGEKLSDFEDHERPYKSGHIGMYTEDALVQFRNFISVV
jgi:Domain of Unknown Function (DUF1080)